MVKNMFAMQETWVPSWRRKWLPTPVFLPGEFNGQRSLAGYSPWGQKESDTTERLTHTYYVDGITFHGLPKWLNCKESASQAGDAGSIPASGSLPGEGYGNPHQCSCLGNPMDRRAWRATLHGVVKVSDTT